MKNHRKGMGCPPAGTKCFLAAESSPSTIPPNTSQLAAMSGGFRVDAGPSFELR